jgi:tetratricopeptide (TPR) repeat protein
MEIRWKLVLVVLISFSASAAETKWIKLKSPNFEMYTTASERSGRETLKYFEQVRAFFVQVMMGSIPGKALPVRIVAFNSKKEYEPYRLNNFATAFYHSTPTTDDIVLSQTGFEVFPVAVHEYVHLVARHSGLNLPPWLNEGMAELYSTLRPSGDKVMVGDLIPGRFQALQREKWVPLTVIVKADHNSPYYNEKDQAGSLYNEGWALTHMLLLTTAYRPEFAKFIGLMNTGISTEEALSKIYGKTVEQLDKELQSYLRGTQFKAALFPIKLEKVNDEIPSEPAAPYDVKLVLAHLMNRPGQELEARRLMEGLTGEDPKRPEAFVALGYLTWRKNSDEAVKYFEKAFALGSREPAMLWDYGRLVRERNKEESIRVLSELMAQEPARVDVRLELAAAQLTSQQPLAALETLSGVKKVTQEDAPRLFTIMAHAQVDKNFLVEARKSAESLSKFAKTTDDKSQAEQLLKYLDAREKGPAPMPVAIFEAAPEASPGKKGEAPPKLQRRVQPRLVGEPPVSAHTTLAGSFVQLDCSGSKVKMVVETADGKKVFLIDDPNKVIGATIELTCGAQKKTAVKVDFIPAGQAGVDGLVRGIVFEQ